MGYLDNSSITVDAILTKKGRELLARNDGSFKVTQFALADDEIDYTMFNENHPNGTQYAAEAIENMALIEAIPDETNIMRHKLVTLDTGTSVLPFISGIDSPIQLSLGATKVIQPRTINFNGNTAGTREPDGYSFTIADARILSRITGDTGTSPNLKSMNAAATTAFSETVFGNTCSLTGISKSALFGSNTTLLTSLRIEGRTSGAVVSVPVQISKKNTIIGAASATATPTQAL
tara:strand:- start:817 stop:1518 length:702 start_codon:yes stop_codon:yes gene_type:complete